MKFITEKISTVMLAVVMAMLIFSACGKTEKSEVEIMQDTSTVDTVCVETVSDTVESVIELHEFYDIFWPEFKAAAIAGDRKKIFNEMTHFPLNGYDSTLTKKDFLEALKNFPKQQKTGERNTFMQYTNISFLSRSKFFDLINKSNGYKFSEKTGNTGECKNKCNGHEITIKIDFFQKGDVYCDEKEYELDIYLGENNYYRLLIRDLYWDWIEKCEDCKVEKREWCSCEYCEGQSRREIYYFAKRNGKYKLIAFMTVTMP